MATWNYSDYQNHGDETFKNISLPAAVIAFNKDGEGLANQSASYQTYAEASAAYDAVVASPGQLWWVGLYSHEKSSTPNGRVDETYFGGIQTTETKTETVVETHRVYETPKASPSVVAKIGLGLAGAFGLLALLGKAR